MRTTKKTEEAAIRDAKLDCIAQLEESNRMIIGSSVLCQLLNNSSLWLITGTSCQCDCGETAAVKVTLFENKITEELTSQWNEIKTDDQYHAITGHCDMCGED